MDRFELNSPSTKDKWSHYHRIRRTVLFEERGRFGIYDENHPDEYAKDNFPKLLVRNGNCIGVARIDIEPKRAIIRRVAIDVMEQRKGYGRILLNLAEDFIRQFDYIEIIESSVANDVVEFYKRCNFEIMQNMHGTSSTMMQKEILAK